MRRVAARIAIAAAVAVASLGVGGAVASAAPSDCHVDVGVGPRSTRSICYRGTGSHQAGEVCLVNGSYVTLYGPPRGIFQPSYTQSCNGQVIGRFVRLNNF
jgi:hypothetical protein